MKALTGNLTALTLLFVSGHGSAEVIYSNLQNITIPTTYAGTYIDVDGGQAPSSTAFTGWDLNPYMGGVYVANNSQFQPGRNAANDMGTLHNFAVGSTIDAGLLLGTGMGGSIDHLGSTFTAGSEGYLGFKNGSNYGWMRVVFTANTSGEVNPVIKDWAYDNSGAAIVTGNVLQSAAVSGAQTVTLTSLSGSFTLGSQITDTSGNTNSVVKTGAGTTVLTGTNSYSGTTTINAGKLTIGPTGTINSTSGVSIGAGEFSYNNSTTALSQGVSFSGTGGTLSGTGTISPAVIVTNNNIQTAGTSVTASNSIATLGKETFTAGITYNQGSIFEWNLTANTDTGTGVRAINYDAINTGGLATTGTGAIFRVVLNGSQNFSEAFWDSSRTWSDIFTNVDGSTNLDIASIFGGGVQYWNSNTGNLGMPTGQGGFTITGSSLVWTAVPEPTGALAGMLLGAGLLRRGRKKTGEASP